MERKIRYLEDQTGQRAVWRQECSQCLGSGRYLGGALIIIGYIFVLGIKDCNLMKNLRTLELSLELWILN